MPHAHARGFPSPMLAHSNDRGGQAPALREKSRPGGLSYNSVAKIKTPPKCLNTG